MKHYIGTDIMEIARLHRTLERWGERFLDRVYTLAERDIYGRRPHSLAACFAGKEAVIKLLGTGLMGVSFKEVEILHKPNGKPYIILHDRAQTEAAKLGITEIDISLSHSREYATATAIGVT